MKVTVPATPSFPNSTQNHSAKKTCLKNAGVIVDTMDQLHEFISREIEKAMEAYKSKLEEIQNTLKTRPSHNIIKKKTKDLVAHIADPEERRKESRSWSGYLKRVYEGKVEKPRCIHEVTRDGRDYVVFFIFEEPQAKQKRKVSMDIMIEKGLRV